MKLLTALGISAALPGCRMLCSCETFKRFKTLSDDGALSLLSHVPILHDEKVQAVALFGAFAPIRMGFVREK